MKLQIALLASLLTVLPVASAADPAQSTTVAGNTINLGAVTAYNLNPAFVSPDSPNVMAFCNDCGGTTYPFYLQTNQSLNALLQNPGVNSTGDAKILIIGFNVSCYPFNPANLATFYPYGPDTNGIAGGTITVTENKLVGPDVTVGTVVLPSSPHGGPYVNTATSTLAAPYTPTAGSNFAAQITSYDHGPSQGYADCTVTAVLAAVKTPAGNG
jgi:hypothetical protein